jgi:hypothetical protein
MIYGWEGETKGERFAATGHALFFWPKKVYGPAGFDKETVMTETNPTSVDWVTQNRPFWMGFLVNVLLGYFIYFVALAQSEPPGWAIGYIEQLKPTLRALETAARLSDRPFPAQVTIVYVAISTVLLTAYYLCCAFLVTHIRQGFHRRLCERVQEVGEAVFSESMYAEHRKPAAQQPQEVRVTAKLRRKFAGMGVIWTLVALGFPMILMLQDPSSISYRAVAFFSSSILSITFLLFLSGIAAVATVIGLWMIYVSVCSFKSSTPIRSWPCLWVKFSGVGPE